MAELKYAWRELTQEYIDWAYEQSCHASNMDQLLEKCKLESVLSRERIGEPSRYAYGSSNDERVDVYSPSTYNNRSAIIYMHGGAWKTGFANSYSYLAEPFLNLGYTVCIPDFANVVQLSGNLSAMSDQACKSIEWSLHYCKQQGIDTVYLIGHSSGAHLSAVYASNYKNYYSNNTPIKSMMLISGLYDLEPVMVSSRRTYLNLTEFEIEELSPIRHLENISVPIDIVFGSNDSPEFIRQSKEFFNSLSEKNSRVSCMCLENTNHYELLEKINQLFIKKTNEKDN